MSIGLTEILLIAGVVLLFFGAKRIPELARSLGRASYEYKKAKENLQRESQEMLDVAEKSAQAEDAKKKPDATKTVDPDEYKNNG